MADESFAPSIVSNQAMFGGALTLDRLVSEVHNGMGPVLREMQAHVRLAHLDLAT